jgi:hypothetical protein
MEAVVGRRGFNALLDKVHLLVGGLLGQPEEVAALDHRKGLVVPSFSRPRNDAYQPVGGKL